MKSAVVIPAEGDPYTTEIPEEPVAEELRALQEIVGGYLEIAPFDSDGLITIFVNEEGKIQGLPKNGRATHLFGGPDWLAGNVVVIGPPDDEGNVTGLDEDMVDQVMRMATDISEKDLRRWAKWDDLRARQAAATTIEERKALDREAADLRDEGIEEMLEDDLKNQEGWWWLSFADPDLPSGSQFLGVVIVKGGGMQEAVQNAWTMGINPGGQVKAIPISDPENVPEARFHNRLLSKEELEREGLA